MVWILLTHSPTHVKFNCLSEHVRVSEYVFNPTRITRTKVNARSIWKQERVAEITGTFSIACYAANEKDYAQGVQEDNNFREVSNERNKKKNKPNRSFLSGQFKRSVFLRMEIIWQKGISKKNNEKRPKIQWIFYFCDKIP